MQVYCHVRRCPNGFAHGTNEASRFFWSCFYAQWHLLKRLLHKYSVSPVPTRRAGAAPAPLKHFDPPVATLSDYSANNPSIAEEVRYKGVEVSVTRPGKFSDSAHEDTRGLALFQGNDPAGAMLAWHGWVISNRQSLQHESLPLPELQPGFVPASSDAFRDLDHRIGMHTSLEWEWHARGRLLIGYSDNNCDPAVVKDNQWASLITFRHVGIK